MGQVKGYGTKENITILEEFENRDSRTRFRNKKKKKKKETECI